MDTAYGTYRITRGTKYVQSMYKVCTVYATGYFRLGSANSGQSRFFSGITREQWQATITTTIRGTFSRNLPPFE